MSIYRGRGRGRGMFHKSTNKNDDRRPSESINLTSSTPSTTHSTTSHNKISINLDLDPNAEAWFAKLRSSWMFCKFPIKFVSYVIQIILISLILVKKSPSIVTMIHNHFDECLNPYEQILRLMYNCQDFKYAKPKSLTYLLLEEFKIWLTYKRESTCSLLTSSIKISAFNLIQQQSLFSLKKLVAEIFEMTKDCDIFLDIIRGMIEKKQYKEVSIIIYLVLLF